MLVAGIDASTKATGVSIMRDGELLYYKLIAIDSKKVPDAYERIKKMFVMICEILEQYEP
jgi:Holliday junction resolvasome RuvABC endonuclease subunit